MRNLLIRRYHFGVRRRGFDILVGVLFLLAIVVGVVWSSRLLPRGWRIRAALPLARTSGGSVQVITGINYVFVNVIRLSDHPVVGPTGSNVAAVDAFEKRFGRGRVHHLGLGLNDWQGPWFDATADGKVRMAGTGSSIGVPFGLILLMLCILPAWRARRWVRWARARMKPPAGCCEHCGYDLRATPERCPECGRVNSEEADEGGR